MAENTSWKLVYDGSKNCPESYMGFVTDECAYMIDNIYNDKAMGK